MRSYLIDTINGTHGYVDCPDSLQAFYDTIGCDCIDIALRAVDGREFDIVCDDEALCQDDPIPSACDGSGKVMLYGSLLLFHHDDDGNLTEISEDDVDHIMANVRKAFMRDGNKSKEISVLCNVEYC